MLLGGCSDYLDRRDTISLYCGEAMATNRVTQMIDPWPRGQRQRNIAYNGEDGDRVERYRTGKVIPPAQRTSSTYSQPSRTAAPSSDPNNTAPLGPTVGRNSRTNDMRMAESPAANKTVVAVLTADRVRAVGALDVRRRARSSCVIVRPARRAS